MTLTASPVAKATLNTYHGHAGPHDRAPGEDLVAQQPVDREAERQDEGYPRQRAVGHDLDADPGGGERHGGPLQRRQPLAQEDEAEEHADQRVEEVEIGRASCRERVCQYVSISVVAVSLKKKKFHVTMFI